ncbi:hypothetical protein [Mycobacterium talmoniae]|nr:MULTISPECIES: hypothetical protein [Mycobacterium]OHV05189.1 hypothetical protein BKN37_06895 [Mycobacterium talmoniae]TDH50203.1 hypothetical protein E2F47_18665 [Mycobacterium eburneum]
MTLGGLGAPSACAAPQIPDFGSYPKADYQDFVVRDTQVYSVRGFQTPDGLFCTSSSHRGMHALDCFGAFPAAPEEANTVHLFSSGAVVSPVAFKVATVGPAEFEGHPLPLLPAGINYAFDGAQCVRDARWLLACAMGTGDAQDGFVVTAGKTEAF